MYSPILLFIFFAVLYSQADAYVTTTFAPSSVKPSSTASTTASTTTTTIPPWISPALGGRAGNAGSAIFLSNKSIDAVHSYSVIGMARAIQSMQFGELSLPSGLGVLTIKPPRVIEAKLTKFQYELQESPKNRIWSRLFGGHLVADGVWQFKMDGADEEVSTGKYKAIISDSEVMTTSQLARTADAKPMVQTVECKINFTELRVEIEGATNLTMVDSCDTPVCNKARKFYEDSICQVLRKFVQESINVPLATFPTRFNLSAEQKLDYALLNDEPKVTKNGVWAGLEGKIQWRGMSAVPFNPPPLSLADNNRMFTFGMADYTLNTLWHQAHSHGYRFSASDLLSAKSPSVQSQLALNCSSPAKPLRRVSPINLQRSIGVVACLGSLLENLTDTDQFSSNDTGDVVYKTDQRAASVFILSDQTAYFDGGNGHLEIYGPAKGKDGQRQLLARAAVQLVRGEFTPKWNGANITGAIKLIRLTLDKAIGQPSSMTSDWLSKLTQLATPILSDMFNTFLSTLAQFPIPMLDGFKCTAPQFAVSARTMQVDCDVQPTKV